MIIPRAPAPARAAKVAIFFSKNTKMNFIHEANDLFNFQNISLNTPTLINGGTNGFFTKFVIENTNNKYPLYIKTPICYAKGGFNITNKKIYGDLVFSREDNEDFNRWMENLLFRTQSLLYQHREEWFQGTITEEDIEEAIINPIKSYKSGKCYLVRCGVKIENGKPQVRVYDLDQNEVVLEKVEEKNIITLLEFKGVRCTMKTFQIEIEVKQIMITKKFDILEKNLLISESSPIKGLEKTADTAVAPEPAPQPTPSDESDSESESSEEEEDISDLDSESSPLPKPPIKIHDVESDMIENDSIEKYLENSNPPENTPIPLNLDNFAVDSEPIKIKKENELYYKMYQEAKIKAQSARKAAIDAYLEARNIKTLYEIEDAEESDQENNLDEIMADIENL